MTLVDRIKQAIRENSPDRLRSLAELMDASISKLTDLKDRVVTSLKLMQPDAEKIVTDIFGNMNDDSLTVTPARTIFPAPTQPDPPASTLFTPPIPPGAQAQTIATGSPKPFFPSRRQQRPVLAQALIAHVLPDNFTIHEAWVITCKFFQFTDEHLRRRGTSRTLVWEHSLNNMLSREVKFGTLAKVKRGHYRLLSDRTSLQHLCNRMGDWDAFFKNPTVDTYPLTKDKAKAATL
jgi:hypothetical protein